MVDHVRHHYLHYFKIQTLPELSYQSYKKIIHSYNKSPKSINLQTLLNQVVLNRHSINVTYTIMRYQPLITNYYFSADQIPRLFFLFLSILIIRVLVLFNMINILKTLETLNILKTIKFSMYKKGLSYV